MSNSVVLLTMQVSIVVIFWATQHTHAFESKLGNGSHESDKLNRGKMNDETNPSKGKLFHSTLIPWLMRDA